MQQIDTMKRRLEQLGQQIVSRELLLAFCIVLAVGAVGLLFGWENNKLVPVNPDPSVHYVQESSPLRILANWDGHDYIGIVEHGYQAGIQANFFPLYPLLVRIAQFAVRSPLISALLVSWLALTGAVYFYLKIFKLLYRLKDNAEALRGVLFFLLFPTGIFLFAAYTEALFACLALGAIYFTLSRRLVPAAALTLLATATHITGLFLLVFLGCLLWEQKKPWRNIIATLLVGSLGIIAYMVFLQIHLHNALAFVTSQKSHGWLNYHHELIAQIFTRKAAFLLAVAASVLYWWPKRKSFSLYSLCFLGIVLLGGLGAFGRYSLVAFPVQIMLYDYFRDKKLGYVLAISFSAVFWTYFLLQYVGGYSGG